MTTAVDTSTAIFECIDGKDDFFKEEISDGNEIILGRNPDQKARDIKELEHNGGFIIVSNNKGNLEIDATNCNIPVKINGQAVSRNSFKVNDVLRIGNSIWRMQLPNSGAASLPLNANAFRQGFSKLIGLEELKDFKLKSVFSEVFKKHSVADMEDQLITGTSRNIPAVTDIETSWAKPWLFFRMLVVGIFLTVLFIVSYKMFDSNPLLIPGLIVVGAFAIPLATLVFFLELNAPRNISIFMILILLAVGGLGSIVISLTLFKMFPFLMDWLKASSAGIIEEIGKLAIVVALFGRNLKYKWILNGLLLGAAIGTGFAAFESAGYIYNAGTAKGFDAMTDALILRGVIAPFMHIIWTANPVAALWLVKGDRPFQFSMLGDMRFLRVMISSMLLHMIWNAPFATIPLPIFSDLKVLILGVIGWIITFRLVQSGLTQLNKARHAEVERLTVN